MVSTDWLKKTELFGALEESQLKVLLSNASVQPFSEGETIFRQGDKANHLYILIHGLVDLKIKAHEEVDSITSKIEKEGAVFGTPALMEPFIYNVTATCLKPSNVLVIETNTIKKNMEEDPKMGMEIMKKLASIYFNRLNELRSGVSNFLKIFKSKTL
jgi:CRP-like cAMP-binding protein